MGRGLVRRRVRDLGGVAFWGVWRGVEVDGWVDGWIYVVMCYVLYFFLSQVDDRRDGTMKVPGYVCMYSNYSTKILYSASMHSSQVGMDIYGR